VTVRVTDSCVRASTTPGGLGTAIWKAADGADAASPITASPLTAVCSAPGDCLFAADSYADSFAPPADQDV